MAKLLITGGAGFIGTNFAHFWAARHPDDLLVVLDALTYAGNRAGLDGLPLTFVENDIRDTELVGRLLADHALDTIVHFAAESHVDRSISGPDAFVETNVAGTHSLLKAARTAWLDAGSGRPHRFHHISTDEVYGSLGFDDPAFTETTPYAPNSPYAASKAASDHLVRAYHRTYGLQTSVTNCSNNYGPYHFPEKLIPLIIVKALAGETLPVYGQGANVRDWLYVEDHVKALQAVFERGQPGRTYNVGGNSEMRNLDVVKAICAVLDQMRPRSDGQSYETQIGFVADRPGHDARYAIDASRIREELGWRPRETFATGLEKTVAWYLANEDWWRPILVEREADRRRGLAA